MTQRDNVKNLEKSLRIQVPTDSKPDIAFEVLNGRDQGKSKGLVPQAKSVEDVLKGKC